jgi:hypothetical protein
MHAFVAFSFFIKELIQFADPWSNMALKVLFHEIKMGYSWYKEIHHNLEMNL